MLTWRTPRWIYVVAAVYVLTICFNARQEAWGPGNAGWVPRWSSFKVVVVVPSGPMDKAGLRVGDVLEAVNGQLLNGMPDWFIARAHFERNCPLELRIRRGRKQLSLQFVITAANWRTWNRAQYLGVVGFYSARFILLLLAILVVFSRPEQPNARLAALMFAIGAVAEGYPSSGWAAALRHLPIVLAIPICLATASCLLASMVWLLFCASFPRAWQSQRGRWAVVLVPIVILGFPILVSSTAMIYAPSVLAKPWPLILSAAPVRAIQDIAGVTPLLFLNVISLSPPVAQVGLLELWLAVTVLYFTAGFVMLCVNYRRLDDPLERRRVGALCVAVVIFGILVVHNVFTRNWTTWFGSAPPVLFSSVTFAGEALLFLLVPSTLAYCVLKEPKQKA